MPIYEYICQNGHNREELRRTDDRTAPLMCYECGGNMEPVLSLPAKRTDGIYSYDPNIGRPDLAEKVQ